MTSWNDNPRRYDTLLTLYYLVNDLVHLSKFDLQSPRWKIYFWGQNNLMENEVYVLIITIVFPKGAYPFLKLLDNSSVKLQLFMDSYSEYNQIPMAKIDKEKEAFMAELRSYCYNLMSFILKNPGANYQRMVNKVLKDHIRNMLKVYMDYMIVNFEEEVDHTIYPKKGIWTAQKYNMWLNKTKNYFWGLSRKILRFLLDEICARFKLVLTCS